MISFAQTSSSMGLFSTHPTANVRHFLTVLRHFLTVFHPLNSGSIFDCFTSFFGTGNLQFLIFAGKSQENLWRSEREVFSLAFMGRCVGGGVVNPFLSWLWREKKAPF